MSMDKSRSPNFKLGKSMFKSKSFRLTILFSFMRFNVGKTTDMASFCPSNPMPILYLIFVKSKVVPLKLLYTKSPISIFKRTPLVSG